MTKSDTKKRGKPPFAPTQEQREQVMLMVGYGMTYREIATLIKNPATGHAISVNTLQKHFQTELAEGEAFVKARVIGNLVRRATKDHPSAVTAAIWYTKARCGWKSTDRFEHHHEGATTGVMIAPTTRAPSDWINDQRQKNSRKKAPASRQAS